MIRLLGCFSLALLLFASVSLCSAQTTSGVIGEVTDQSGAAVPGATVELQNKTTGSKFDTTTSGEGFYRFNEIPPGQGYSITVSAKGFASFSVKDIYLTVSNTRTQNVVLSVGSQVSTVEVTASNAEVTIDTTSASVGNTFDVVALNALPVQSRNDPTALFGMQPGVTNTGSVTGARVDQNYITLDGLDVTDIATGGASQTNSGISDGFSGTIVGHAPVDAVEEFHAGVAGSDASTGPAGGGQFQLVTKSGTNSFHGNVNEYHRDEDLAANSWFSNDSTPIIPRNHLIQNQFGGNFGGPVIHNKLFFFFNYLNSKIIKSAVAQRTVPLNNLRNGILTYCTNASDDCSTTATLNAAQIAGFDPQHKGTATQFIGTANSFINKRYPASNNTVTGDGVNSGGFNFNAPAPDDATNYVGRGDYNINDNQKFFARFNISREDRTQNLIEFPGDPPTDLFQDRSYAFVIGHNWVIGGNKTNRVFLGETVEKYGFPNDFNPLKSTFFTFGDGADQALASSPYLNPSSSARRIPIEMLGDDFSLTKGKHTWQFGGTFKDILAHDTTVGDYNTTEIGLGGQTLGLCGPNPGDCGAGNPSLRPADIDPTNALYYDEAFTFMLGRVANVQSDYNYNAQGQVLKQLTGDQRYYRYYQLQMYLEDAWKVTPSLTASWGLNYQFFSVPYETHGLESVEPFTFDQYMQARLLQTQLGQTGNQAVPLISYVLGGKANNGPPLYKPEYRTIAPHVGFIWNPGFDKKSVFNASGGIVYDRTVIFAIQSLQDAYSYLFQQTASTPSGVHNNPYASVATDPRLDASNGLSNVSFSPPSTPTPPYQPFTTGGVPFGLQNGLAFNETIDPDLKTPYSITFGAGWQRSMPADMVLKINYVGRLGRRLLSQADANQVLDFVDPTSGEHFGTAFGSITTQIRQGVAAQNMTVQPWFENQLLVTPGTCATCTGFASNTAFIAAALGGLVRNGDFGDFTQAISAITNPNVGMGAQFSENSFHGNLGFSAYHGLLVSLQKNLSHGLHFDFNYTWSHSIDNISFFANSQGDTGIGGGGLICDVVRPRECRSRSDFDVRQYITGDALYQLPFGKNKMFLATLPHWADEAVGGWSLSGVVERHTGFPWQTASNAYVASYSNDAPAIFTGTDRSVIHNTVNKLAGGGVSDFKNASAAAHSFSGPVGFKIGNRNDMQGPGYFNMDAGLAKTFPIYAEKVNLNFRADAFNVLNHPNFDIPDENVFNGFDNEDIFQGSGFGAISDAIVPPGNANNGARVLELSLRLEF